MRLIPHSIALVLLAAGPFAGAQQRAVDFRYAPPTHFTAICFPSDWQKTLISERGSLAYDFGPGPYARPLTEVSLAVKGTDLTVETLAIKNPRVPVADVRWKGSGSTVIARIFALVPGRIAPQQNRFSMGKIRRLGGLNGAVGWANPPEGVDPAFRGAAWGTNRPIIYRVRIPAGAARRVALGLCEPYKWTTGHRVLELHVEGAPMLTVDALKDNQKNRPYVYFFDGRDENNDGWLAIEVHASQRGIDPNVILNAFWVFPAGAAVSEEAVIRGEGRRVAELVWACGAENELGAPAARVDGIIAQFDAAQGPPTIVVRSPRQFTFDPESGILSSGGRPFILSRPAATGVEQNGTTWTLALPAGTREAHVVIINGPLPGSGSRVTPDLRAELLKTRSYWEKHSAIPFDRITVPDPGIQYLLDASIRNLYQISERVDGNFQFQPGPSVYRGLWIHDQVWHTSAALYLGDTLNVRRAIENMLRYQQPDGRIFQSEPFPMQRETPLVVYIMTRYAAFTGNTDWLKRHWPSLLRAVNWIRWAHASTLRDPSARFYGLFPPGFADGGLGGLEAEYGSSYWGMIGLRSAAQAANSLGLADSARSWGALADDILKAFFRSASRDARRDAHGNLFLPMKVGDTSSTIVPQQANWGILDGQGLGHLFAYDEPVVTGTLSMLDATSREGLPQSVGWLKDGIWAFFGALHGITHVYQRNYVRAQDILYAYANHASPLGTWVEEQLPKGEGTRTTGDASNATASSLYIKLLRRLLVIERGDTLDLLAGVPSDWYAPGARIRLTELPTLYGPLSLDFKISTDGLSGSLSVDRLARGRHCIVRISLDALKRRGFVLPGGRALPAILESQGMTKTRLSFVRLSP